MEPWTWVWKPTIINSKISQSRNQANEKARAGFAAGKDEPQKILYVFSRIQTQSATKDAVALKWATFEIDTTSNSYRTQAIVSEWLQRFNAFKWRLNTIYKEFDPGSGRTLAARLTHASRTESRGACFSWLSGERVSNAWVTCPGVGDNSWKRLLIPHKPTARHRAEGKGFIRFRMDSRPIS